MRRSFAVVFVALTFVALMAAGCSSAEPPGPLESCTSPPADALTVSGELTLDVNPNPVTPGAQAILSVSHEGAGDALVGAGAMWQCWNGEEWVSTHQLVKGRFGNDGLPEVNSIEPGVTWTIPAVGLPLPDSREIVIPSVPPGTYRIWDDGSVDSVPIEGSVIVTIE